MARLNLEDPIIRNPSFSGKLLDPGLIKVPDAATYTVLAINSGRIHVLPDLTASCAIALPAVAVGLTYRFWYGGAAADAQDWVITALAGAFFKGGVTFHDQDTDVVSPVYANGTSHLILTVVKPEVGTDLELVCDGTYWYLNGRVLSITTAAIT